MSILNSVLKIFVGDKKKNDLKLLQPIITNVRAFENEISKLSNDELRAKTIYFKQKIAEGTNEFTAKIKALNEEAHQANVDRKEEIYNEIDTLEDLQYQASEKILNEIMAEAFAVVKETAKRFTENEQVVVTATPFDRELSATRDNIILENDKAIWENTWDAQGKAVTWDMIHYDVQLIGGGVLHQGKIAEMMTGEGKTLVLPYQYT